MLKATASIAKSTVLVQQSAQTGFFLEQTRNVFILKRRWPPKLAKKNQQKAFNRVELRNKNFIYDLVEDTGVVRKPKMQVLLTTFVEGLGQKGDIVSVKPIQAYNTLLLPGLGTYPTPENIEKYARKDDVQEEKHSSPFAEKTVETLERMIFPLTMNKENPWKVEPWHVKVSLRKVGIFVKEAAIELPQQPITGPDMLKENKEFTVTITINNQEKALVRFRIHHWATEPSERLPYVFEYWKESAEPLFGQELKTEDPKNV